MFCGEVAQHDPDHGEADKGASFAGMPLVVACQATVTADPCQRALNDPTLWQHDEAAQVGPFDDFQLPGSGACDQGLHSRSLIAAVADDAFDEWKTPPGLPQEQFTSVAVLNVGRMDIDTQQQA
jgi:hypothetical protein